ncbi:MAG: hypothetical protein ABJF04_14635 [Reichenbachiella sp.]|uniref:hypothetical protein n=1 Tax=Reichenbachiella sp. TaxID=2184521 RepID=UPI003262DF32
MPWKKKGRIFVNDKKQYWNKQYCGIPTAYLLSDEKLRIYYYSMDDKMDGRISYIDVSAEDPKHILYVHAEPVIDIGSPGTFDDSGICPSAVISIEQKTYMYYFGVQRTEKTPYMYFAGLGEILDDDTIIRTQNVPILDRTTNEPYLRSASTILKDDGRYMMIYVSANEWFTWNNKQYPKYILRKMYSKNGLDWNGKSDIVLNFEHEGEFGFGRPWLIKENGVYKLYYSIRSTNEPYKLGYAESTDGVLWERKDYLMDIKRSKEGWDSEMVCYPCVVSTKYGKYLFYNGNQHGASGFGYAIWQEQ